MADKSQSSGLKSLVEELPFDRLKDELQHGLATLGEKAISTAGERLTDFTERLNDVADGGGFVGGAAKEGAKEAAEGGSPVKGALKGGLSGAKDKIKEKLGGGGSGGEKGTKSTNIVEEIDIGAPIDVVYNQWTQFQDWSGFMKKVDTVDQEDEAKANFKAQVFWSHRRWEAHILEQVPDDKIVWRSKGEKGHVDGAVTFHELAPNLTRVLVVLEYYPQGLFERTGNLWRAQGRRARLELKHFRRHVMTQVLQNPDDLEGWRGVIEDGKVVRSHDEVVEEEQQEQDDSYDEGDEPDEESGEDSGEDAADDEVEDEYEDEEPEDEYDEEAEEPDEESDEEAPEDEYEDEEPEAEYDEESDEDAEESDEDAEEAEEPEDEYEEEPEAEEEYEEEAEEPEDDYEEEAPRRRRKAS